MGSFGLVRHSLVFRMLDLCAPGWSYKTGRHNICFRFQGRSFPSLPSGEHGAKDPEVQLGKIKQMIRQLEISLDCAEREIPAQR